MLHVHVNNHWTAEWWSEYGASAPNLRAFAVKILSLTCSASGCERNWSVFENVNFSFYLILDSYKLIVALKLIMFMIVAMQLHTKGRNRLAQQRMNSYICEVQSGVEASL